MRRDRTRPGIDHIAIISHGANKELAGRKPVDIDKRVASGVGKELDFFEYTRGLGKLKDAIVLRQERVGAA